jgi:hypothetical protein
MKHSLRSLTVAVLCPWLGVSGQWSVASDAGAPRRIGVPPVQNFATPDASPRPGFTIIRGQEPALSEKQLTGQELVAQAAQRLADERQISAELRYKVAAYGHELLGTGHYLQLGAGEDRLVRLDLRMQVGEKPATLLEIRGSELCWMRRDIPPAQPTLERLNLRQVRKALENAPAADQPLPHSGWIILGGLPRLLDSLEHNFEFDAPKPDEVQYQAADGKSIEKLPIWIVSGKWKRQRLAALANRKVEKLGTPPDQLPDQVEVVLGRTTDQLPLFPFRITYRRTPASDPKSPASTSTTPATPRDLLTLEFFSVSATRPIDPRSFHYQPGEQYLRDITTESIERLSGEGKGKKLR